MRTFDALKLNASKLYFYFSNTKNPGLFKTVVLGVAFLEILDIILTIIGMDNGATELNSFMSTTMVNYGYSGLVLIKVIAFFIYVYLFRYFVNTHSARVVKTYGYFIVIMLNAVVINNIFVLIKQGVI